MINAEAVARKFAAQGRVRSEVAVFVRMDGRFAIVNIGDATVPMPCVGFYPPAAGMSVRVDWVNGSPAVTGPVTPLNPLGVISGTGSPKAAATVDGVEYMLFYRDGYTPAVADQVEINWVTGVIQGKVTGVETPEAPPESSASPKPFELVVRAQASGRFNSSGRWGNSDPWASNTTRGLWTYGDAIRSAVAGASIKTVDIYLPLSQQVGNASIGFHEYGQLPNFFPTILDAVNLPFGSRNGWVRIPYWSALSLGQRGVGVFAPGGGYTIWRGVASDPLSGALRFNGMR